MVIENYSKNSQLPSDEVTTYNSQMTELAYTIVDQKLMGSTLVDEKLFTTPAGEYQYFACVELNKNELKEALINELKRIEKIQTEVELEDFRQIFDQQMATIK